MPPRTAHVKLLTENLGNPRPGLFYKIFRASHPSAGERIDFANSYHPWRCPTSSKRDDATVIGTRARSSAAAGPKKIPRILKWKPRSARTNVKIVPQRKDDHEWHKRRRQHRGWSHALWNRDSTIV